MSALYRRFVKDIEALLGLTNTSGQDELVLVFSLLTNSYMTGRELADDYAMPPTGRLSSIDTILAKIENKTEMVIEAIGVSRRLFDYLLLVFIDKPFYLPSYDSNEHDFEEFVGSQRFRMLRLTFPFQFLYFLAILGEIKTFLPQYIGEKLPVLVARFERYAAISRTAYEFGKMQRIFGKTEAAGDLIHASARLAPMTQHITTHVINMTDVEWPNQPHWQDVPGFRRMAEDLVHVHLFSQRYGELIRFYYTMIGDEQTAGNWILETSDTDDDMLEGYFKGEPLVVKRAYLACNLDDIKTFRQWLERETSYFNSLQNPDIANFMEAYGQRYTAAEMTAIKGDYMRRKSSLMKSYEFWLGFDVSVLGEVFEICLFQYFGYSSCVRLHEGYDDFKRSPRIGAAEIGPDALTQLSHMYDRCNKFFINDNEYFMVEDTRITLKKLTPVYPNRLVERIRQVLRLGDKTGIGANYKFSSIVYT